MKTVVTLLALVLLSTTAAAMADESSEVSVYDLKVEHLRNPIQLDTPQPRFSWKIKVDGGDVQSVTQKSYRVLVASSEELLNKNEGDLWDSGIVESPESVLVQYEGENLKSRQTCFWKVQITDSHGRLSHGQLSSWSNVAKWEMALLKPSDWSGSQWIGLDKTDRKHELSRRRHKKFKEDLEAHPSPLLRKEIEIQKEVRKATAYISGVGYAELYINGKKISDHLLDPGQTNYNKHTLYVVHDISDALKQGQNAVGVWLGNGFYGQNLGFDKKFGYGKPSVRAKLFVDYEDGTSEEFVTDTSWKATASPIVFDNAYWGESYDARLEIPGWSEVGLDDSEWHNAVSAESPCPDDKLRPQLLPPIKEIERIKPIEIRKVGKSTWLLDFGKNISGWVDITVDQNAGEVIKIFPAEVVTKDDDRRADQATYGGAPGSPHELYYVCKGGGQESWAPRFNYGGFQYVEISGLANAPDASSVEAVFVRSAVEKTGSFTSSNELLNQYYAASCLSLEGNWHSLPEDCPHREKCGWLGDAHAVADLSLYSYDMSRFYAKFIRDIEDSLRRDKKTRRILPKGAPGVPTMVAPGKRANRIANIDWGVAYLILPWQTYLHTGDVEMFKPQFENIKNFITYYRTFKNKQGVIDNGLGDWCPPRWDRKQAPEFMECHPYVSGTAFYFQALQIASKMAKILGDTDYSQQCLAEAEEIRAAFADVYLKPIESTDLQHYGSQTATVMAMKLGMVSAREVKGCVAALLHDINELHDGHHACGIHGLRHLYTVLADNGHDELAFKLLTDQTFPSPGYVISCGLSTWPERRWEWKKQRYRNSFNHPMNGGFVAFMHESVGGIRPDANAPGYKHFQLKPHLTQQLDWAKASVESPYGLIRSEWKNEADSFQWEIEIPVNSSATVYVPNPKRGQLMLDDQPFEGQAIQITLSQQQWLKCELGSGIYKLTIP